MTPAGRISITIWGPRIAVRSASAIETKETSHVPTFPPHTDPRSRRGRGVAGRPSHRRRREGGRAWPARPWRRRRSSSSPAARATGYGGPRPQSGATCSPSGSTRCRASRRPSTTRTGRRTKAFDGASAVVMYCDGGNGHLALKHLKEISALNEKGVGIGVHPLRRRARRRERRRPATAGPSSSTGSAGTSRRSTRSTRTGRPTSTKFPKHPVASGVKPFTTNDEWYYHMRFRDDMKGVTPILTAVPPDRPARARTTPTAATRDVREGVGKNTAGDVVVGQREQGRHAAASAAPAATSTGTGPRTTSARRS